MLSILSLQELCPFRDIAGYLDLRQVLVNRQAMSLEVQRLSETVSYGVHDPFFWFFLVMGYFPD